jgi:hypothetical protein
MKFSAELPAGLDAELAHHARLDDRVHELAWILNRPYSDVHLEFLQWSRSVPITAKKAIGIAFGRAYAGFPLPWDEKNGVSLDLSYAGIALPLEEKDDDS